MLNLKRVCSINEAVNGTIEYLKILLSLLILYCVQVYAMPVFDMIETILIKRYHAQPGLPLRIVSRSAYVGKIPPSIISTLYVNIILVYQCWTNHADVSIGSRFTALTLFIGVTFPFFGDLLGFFGGFGFSPTSYFVSF